MSPTPSEPYSGPLPELLPLLERVRRVVTSSVRGFVRHDGFTSSAALAFFFLMSLFPFLIFLASSLALMPIPHLATRMVRLVSHFVPDQTMPMVESMLTSTMHTDNRMLSAGFILAVISASNAVAAMSDALNTIYEVKGIQSFWKSRLNAVSMTFVLGALVTIALGAILLGPHFAGELARVFNVSRSFVAFWPYIRWALVITSALASMELLYFLGPARQHSLRKQFPGSVFAVVVWIGSSGLLGIYLRKFSYFNAMYGTLASFIVLMMWLQFTAMAILLGAELNVELEKRKKNATWPVEPVRESPGTQTVAAAKEALKQDNSEPELDVF
jgi:membrane protein